MAIFFALVALLSWSFADTLAALSSRKVGHIATYIISQIVALTIAVALIPFLAETFDVQFFLIALFLAVIDGIGTICFFKAFEEGNVPLNGTIAGSFGLVTALLAFTFFSEPLNLGKVIGIVLIFLGIIISSLRLHEIFTKHIRNFFTDKGIVYALIAMIMWGIYFAFIRIPVEKIGWFWAWFPLNLLFIFLLPVRSFRDNVRHALKIKKGILFVVLFALFANAGMMAFNIGILSGYTSVVAPIAGASPVLFVIISRFVFKDRLIPQQWAGIVVALLGIVLLGLS